MGRRIRHHIDPFKCRIQLNQSDWIDKYKSGSIEIDIGCCKGEFIAALAKMFPDKFFIGIEIRTTVAEKYFSLYNDIPNLALLNGNINLSLKSMFTDYKINKVYINFPDPYTKKRRYIKRRIVTKELVNDLYNVMEDNGNIFIQTDHSDLFEDMDELFKAKFNSNTDLCKALLLLNNYNITSSWEIECAKKHIPVCRAVYTKQRDIKDIV